MDNIFVLFKEKKCEIPNEFILHNIYKQYNSQINFFCIGNNKIHANTNYINFDDFMQDLKFQVNKDEMLVIVFNKNNNQHISNTLKRNFYHTTDSIFVSNQKIDFIDYMSTFNCEQNKQLFEMFTKKNWGIIIRNNQVEFYGRQPISQFGFLLSEKIQPIFNLVLPQFESNYCQLCQSEKIYPTTAKIFVNKSIYVCEKCFKKLNGFQCEHCKNFFSNKYRGEKNCCLQCTTKIPLETKCYVVDSWLGLQYLGKILNIKIKDKLEIFQLFKTKSDKQLLDIKNKTLDYLKNQKLFDDSVQQLCHNLRKRLYV